MATPPPASIADFKTRFFRDFRYGSGTDKVTDTDITNAINDAMPLFNPSLFTIADGKLAFLHASAHFLVVNIQAAGGLQSVVEGLGIENQPLETITGRGAGGVNFQAEAMPGFIQKNAALQGFWKTEYGRKYLGMLQPRLVGNVGAVEGPLAADAAVSPSVPFSDY